jgi:hypothetical protein
MSYIGNNLSSDEEIIKYARVLMSYFPFVARHETLTLGEK